MIPHLSGFLFLHRILNIFSPLILYDLWSFSWVAINFKRWENWLSPWSVLSVLLHPTARIRSSLRQFRYPETGTSQYGLGWNRCQNPPSCKKNRELILIGPSSFTTYITQRQFSIFLCKRSLLLKQQSKQNPVFFSTFCANVRFSFSTIFSYPYSFSGLGLASWTIYHYPFSGS